MQTKQQAILLWTYTRDEDVLASDDGKKFVHLVLDSLLLYQGQQFKIDNFDLTLIVQSITNCRNNKAGEFMQKLFTLAKNCDAQALNALDKMSIHEFVTIAQFYLANLPLMSNALIISLLDKVMESVQEFNEL